MKDVAFGFGDEPIRVAGALALLPGRFGGVVSRLSARSQAQIIDEQLRLVTVVSSGARLELRTDADAIELDLHLTGLKVLDRPPAPLALDVVVDGGPPRSVPCPDAARLWLKAPGDVELIDHPPVTLTLDALGAGSTHVEVWLPHNGSVELIAARVPDGATATRPAPARRRWVHYGSSISHCVEARRPTETWPAAVARRHDLDLLNLGLAGQCQLDQMVARDIRDTAPDLISIKIGVNVVNHDTFRERTFVPALHGFLDTIREGLPDTPILVLTSIICPPAETVPGPTLAGDDGRFYAVERSEELSTGALSIQRIRELVTTVVTSRIAAGDANLSLGDGLALFGPDDAGDLPDDLHPSPDGYLLIADRFSALVFGESGAWAGLDQSVSSAGPAQ